MVFMRVTSPVCTPIYMLIMSFEPIYTFVSTRYGVDWLLASVSQLYKSIQTKWGSRPYENTINSFNKITIMEVTDTYEIWFK